MDAVGEVMSASPPTTLPSASTPLPCLLMPCPRTPPGRDTMSPPPLHLSWHTTQHPRLCTALVQGTQHDATVPFARCHGTQHNVAFPLVPLLARDTMSLRCLHPFAVDLGCDTMSLLPSVAESARCPPFPFSPPLACDTTSTSVAPRWHACQHC